MSDVEQRILALERQLQALRGTSPQGHRPPGVVVLDEGTNLGKHFRQIDFIGASVAAADGGSKATVTITLSSEEVQDIVGAMVAGNTETGITVTYQDSDGTIDFEVSKNANEHYAVIAIENPTATEDFGGLFFHSAVTIQECQAVVVGSATPSVTIDPRHGTDRSAAGAQLLNAATAITNTTTGQNLTSFTDATLAADEWLWLPTTAKSGTVTWVIVEFRYTFD